MAEDLKALGICLKDKSLTDFLIKEPSLSHLNINWSFSDVSDNASELEERIRANNFCIAEGEPCLELDKIVKHRSVGSHFLNYMDFVTCESKKLWGRSIFSSIFLEILLKAIQNQDFKGAVIFLGDNPLALPTLEVLARFGFEDFVFLTLDEKNKNLGHYEKCMAGLLNTKVSTVDSATFIQSQKEYSFCFVMEDDYSQQTLEDMSYFHFLSSQSIVFDLSGASNFLFKEVKALGVNVTDFEVVAEVRKSHLVENILEFAAKIS